MSLLRRFDHWGLASRIVALSLVLLLLVQAIGFGVVRASIARNAKAQIAQELDVGARVWQRLLDQNAQKLRQSATLLAADFGFKSAVSSADVDTIASALQNNGERIGATVTALLDTDLQVRALGEGQDAAKLSPTLTRLAAQLSSNSQGSWLALMEGQPYQFVMVPMRAPVLIAWVVMGFPLDQRLADDMRALSGLHVALLSGVAQGVAPAQVSFSTLAAQDHPALADLSATASALSLGSDTLVVRRIALDAQGGQLQTLLLRSMDEVIAPFRQVQVVLAVITALGVILFGLGSAFTARRVTTPLRALVRASERLGQGDYATPLNSADRHDEIGDLAKAFDHMRVSIAAKQAEVQQLAYWDTLTGLPNRVQFRETLRQAMQRLGTDPAIQGRGLSVVMLDLDRFKHVNDTLGYGFGDRLLQAVALRLEDQTRQREDRRSAKGRTALERRQQVVSVLPGMTKDMVARLGGDEFAVLLVDCDAKGALDMAQRIATSFEIALSFEDQTVDLSAGIGIVCWPTHAGDVDNLLSRAEIAMYTAKTKTTGPQFYDASLDSSNTQTLSLLTELRHAVGHGELRLYLQPKITLSDGSVAAAEALVRWQHPVRGLVPPDHFIPFAEQTGFVRQLTLWMLNEAASQWQALQRPGQALRIAVNLSTRDLLDQEFPAKLDAVLLRHDVPPSAFCLEITESAIMDDPQRAENTLNRLAERGFKLSIDDFGTGYSSLAYLKRLPVAELKIDKSFVMGMQVDADDAKIVRSTIDLAHNLGLTVVAEGVENADIMAALKALLCDEAQGYHMSRPVPVPDFVVWRDKWVAAQKR
jgi:predicted signal transduction protein with EAL and GGDEF domain